MEPDQIASVIASPTTLWGSFMGAVVMGFVFIEKYLSNRKGENVMVKALTEDNARLIDRLRDETKRADDNEDRADRLGTDNNALIREFAEIKASHERVLERVDWITKQNDQLLAQNSELVQQNRELTARLNDILSRSKT